MTPSTDDFGHLTVIPASGVQSLAWVGEKLIDYAGICTEYSLDGTKRSLSVTDTQKLISLASLEEKVGTMFAAGNRHVLGCDTHPKLIDLSTGRVVHRWPDVQTGQQASSIIGHIDPPPPIAYSPPTGRLAVADDKQIVVISLNPGFLN